jgi:hypothetical protein
MINTKEMIKDYKYDAKIHRELQERLRDQLLTVNELMLKEGGINE